MAYRKKDSPRSCPGHQFPSASGTAVAAAAAAGAADKINGGVLELLPPLNYLAVCAGMKRAWLQALAPDDDRRS